MLIGSRKAIVICHYSIRRFAFSLLKILTESEGDVSGDLTLVIQAFS